MGTETEKLQAKLIQLSKSLGWSNNQLAKELYHELSDDDNPEEIKRFCERFKKELQRSSVSVERLQTYIDAVYRNPVYAKQGKVAPIRPEVESFSDQGKRRLRKISKMISDDVEAQIFE